MQRFCWCEYKRNDRLEATVHHDDTVTLHCQIMPLYGALCHFQTGNVVASADIAYRLCRRNSANCSAGSEGCVVRGITSTCERAHGVGGARKPK
jgi:hypothetical protein